MEEEQKMKIEYTKDKLKIEISIDDLIELFETSEHNYNGETNLYYIKEDRKEDFLKYIKNSLEEAWKDMIYNNEDFLKSKIDF